MPLQIFQMNSLKNKDKYKEIKFNGKNTPQQFLLLGISSSQKIHKLAWAINSSTGLQLAKTDDYSASDSINKTFSVFKDILSPTKSFFLFENKIEDNFLSKKYKNIDFFFIISHTDQSETPAKEFFDSIKSIEGVLGAFALEPCKDINKAFLQISV